MRLSVNCDVFIVIRIWKKKRKSRNNIIPLISNWVCCGFSTLSIELFMLCPSLFNDPASVSAFFKVRILGLWGAIQIDLHFSLSVSPICTKHANVTSMQIYTDKWLCPSTLKMDLLLCYSPWSSSLLLVIISVTISSAGEPIPLSKSLSGAVWATAGSPSPCVQWEKTEFTHHWVHCPQYRDPALHLIWCSCARTKKQTIQLCNATLI